MTGAATWYDTIDTPVGEVLLAATADGLTAVYFETRRHGPANDDEWRPRVDARDGASAGAASDVLLAAGAQLGEYFARRRTRFELPLAAAGTPFQLGVWRALATIPFGETISYRELARRAGAGDAARAAGSANARNPLSIIVPCHRVIGARGDLTGFGGGIDRKCWLLTHEGALPGELGSG